MGHPPIDPSPFSPGLRPGSGRINLSSKNMSSNTTLPLRSKIWCFVLGMISAVIVFALVVPHYFCYSQGPLFLGFACF